MFDDELEMGDVFKMEEDYPALKQCREDYIKLLDSYWLKHKFHLDSFQAEFRKNSDEEMLVFLLEKYPDLKKSKDIYDEIFNICKLSYLQNRS